jgi:hypothetical protein
MTSSSNALIKARDIATDIDSFDFWSPLHPFFTIWAIPEGFDRRAA